MDSGKKIVQVGQLSTDENCLASIVFNIQTIMPMV